MKTAIYLRISDKDYNPEVEYDEFTESNSIDNQRLLILDYISVHEDIDSEVIEYIDDGYTGTNFNRPAFQRMMKDIKDGKANTVIVKDLSRLGRDYIETGDYIEQIFPLLGVRVIAINSNYDSNDHIGDVAGLDVVITNFINTMYSRDLSRKRKTSDRARWANGNSCVKNVPYGYDRKLKTTEWVIDEEAGKVVEYIFQKAASGWTLKMIVDSLNEQKIDPPGLYKKKKHNYKINFKVASHENLWDTQKVRGILKRREYFGTLTAHRRESIEYMYNKERAIPESEWVVIPNHHVPIISKELFEEAQYAINSVQKNDDKKTYDYSLKSRLRCGNCRLAFDYREIDGREICYCGHKMIAGKYSTCTGKIFSYDKVEKNVYEMLNKTIGDIKHLDSMMENSLGAEIPDNNSKIKKLESEVSILKADRIRQYETYTEGGIPSEMYLSQKKKITEKINVCESEIQVLKSQVENDENLSKEVKLRRRIAEEVIKEPALNLRTVSLFIENVYVHDVDKLEINYTFDNLLDRAMERNNEVMMKYFPEAAKEAELDLHHTLFYRIEKKDLHEND